MYFVFFILFYSNYNSIVNIGCRYVTGRLAITKMGPNSTSYNCMIHVEIS